uniref:Uncharacterized protein n=1 Tax=Ananas comosus var. bracteatus TaxID=296719 RepID=A0A6V7QNR5_ANACO|nr:unnamed protein product [Ananas comosus var. bracteatus]
MANDMNHSQRRVDGRKLARCPRIQMTQKTVEAIEQACGARIVAQDELSGAVRVKIVLSKQQLKQMVAMIGRGRSNAGPQQSSLIAVGFPQNLEQLFYALRRRHAKKSEAAKGRRNRWRPALQSIPEEA